MESIASLVKKINEAKEIADAMLSTQKDGPFSTVVRDTRAALVDAARNLLTYKIAAGKLENKVAMLETQKRAYYVSLEKTCKGAIDDVMEKTSMSLDAIVTRMMEIVDSFNGLLTPMGALLIMSEKIGIKLDGKYTRVE